MHRQNAARFRVKVVKEFIAARRERPNIDRADGAGRNHFLDAQRHTFKFHRRSIKVLDLEGQRPIRRRADFGRLKTMVLHCAVGRSCARTSLPQRINADPMSGTAIHSRLKLAKYLAAKYPVTEFLSVAVSLF